MLFPNSIFQLPLVKRDDSSWQKSASQQLELPSPEPVLPEASSSWLRGRMCLMLVVPCHLPLTSGDQGWSWWLVGCEGGRDSEESEAARPLVRAKAAMLRLSPVLDY